MTRNMQPGPINRWLMIAIVALATISIGVTDSLARSARVGMLWDDFGRSGEEGWGGTAMAWPGGFWKEDFGSENFAKASTSYKGFLYGFQDFIVPPDDDSWDMNIDELPGTVMPYYMVVRDIKNTPGINGLQLIKGTVQLTYRSNPTVVTTDGESNNPPDNPDDLTGADPPVANPPEDPSLPADVRIVSQWRNHAGVQTTRTVYAFANRNHDDYHIWHYNFKNTGKYCCPSGLGSVATADPDAQFDQTLHNFHFSHSMWFMDRSEGGRRQASSGEHRGDNLNNYKGHSQSGVPESVTSDTKTIAGVNGTVNDYGDLRVQYAWDGDSPTYVGNDFGDPERITGRMLSPRWPGLALIHADAAFDDPSDDPNQPVRSDYDNHGRMPQINADDLPGAYEFMYKGMTGSTHGPLVAGGLNNQYQQDALRAGVPYGETAPNHKFTGSETILSVGDWEFPPGEEINVTWVSAVGGIPYAETVELGRRLRLDDADPDKLTEEARLEKYFTLEDSLFTILRRAQNTISRDVSTLADLDARLLTQDVQSPPNAGTFAVNSGAGKIQMTWTAPMSRASEVAKYRVYRARGSRVGDFPFGLVYEGTDLAFDDDQVAVGIEYYYYLVTVNAAGIESSMHMARTEHGVGPSTAAATKVEDPSGAGMGAYVVPNPWDGRNQLSTFQSAKGQPMPGFAENVTFYGLPAKATIVIFTLDGNQIKQIEHDATGGTEPWDLTSDAGQPIVSGVYIYVVDSDAGKAVGKLVVVR